MRKLILISILPLLLTSCVTHRMNNPKFKSKICQLCGGRDTITTTKEVQITKIEKDTLIKTEIDTALQYIYLGCDSLGNVYIKQLNQKNGKIISLNTSLKDNIIQIEALKSSESILVSKVKDLEYKLSVERSKTSSQIEIPVPYLPWWVKFILIPLAVIGGIFSIYACIRYGIPLIVKIIRKSTIGV